MKVSIYQTRPSAVRQALSLRRWLAIILPAAAALAVTANDANDVTAIQFNRDVRPILSDNCFACHGPDANARKGKFRLDTKEGLFEARPKHKPAVVPGKPDESELWHRLITTDPDDVMPPAESHKVLKPEQKELIKKWIAAGAQWQGHWAFVKPDRPPVPKIANRKSEIANPIDAFVLARLADKGLKPATEADRRTLARRLALDLTGLPPTPEEVEAFVKDRSRDYYEKFVRQLMDSPQWGEHRARYWLDAARYADTHGLHFDNYREMWPYRDWVIRAFNRNLSFDKFTIEQLAGDLLPEPDDDQLIATGFHRCNMTTNEGGTIEEENLANYANDRVTTTAWVWLGLTANCAACHDHKFDPITQRDFYSMAAFYRNTKQPGLDGNVKDSRPSLTVVQDENERRRWKTLLAEIETTKKTIEQQRKEAEPEFEKWVGGLKAEDVERALSTDGLNTHVMLTEGKTNEVAAQLSGQEKHFTSSGTVTLKSEGQLGPALHFAKGATVEFPAAGDFDQGQAFSYGAWVFLPKDFNDSASILARMDEKNGYRGWDLWHEQGKFAAHIVNKWTENAIKVRTAKALAKKGRWQHVFVTYAGSGKAADLKIFVDGAAVPTEVENGNGVSASIRTTAPFTLLRRSPGAAMSGSLQDVRIYSRVLAPLEVNALAHMSTLRTLLATPLAEWKKELRQEVFDYYLSTRVPPFNDAQNTLAVLEKEKEDIRRRNPVTHIQQEKMDSLPMANILYRGAYDKPKDKVGAATIAVLHKMPENAPPNRLGLAQWLVSPENSLTARVIVNRFWAEIFGIGLVKTAEDFGTMGETPVNQALLDWLAVEFIESGWDVKHIFKLMVMSATYRQSAETTPEKLEKDLANRLVSRGPRFRMDAEMVRDYALATSGLLVKKIGGPSVKPYQPDRVWETVAMPESDTRIYKRDSGEALYRRSLYTFWKRAAPPALMDTFNAPSRENCTVRRERTNTPLQALATLNDPQFIEAARHLAQETLKDGKSNFNQTVDFLARRVLARPLRPQENGVVQTTHAKLLAFYEAQPDEAKKLLSIGESKADESVPAPQLAALTMIANQLLNLDEVLNK